MVTVAVRVYVCVPVGGWWEGGGGATLFLT